MMTIDFESNVPYYVQLALILKEFIQRKIWSPGDRIPSESELCEKYQVSRTVIRQALQELEQEGWIVRRKGKGTFVAEPKINENLAQKLTGFYQDMVERGLTPTTQVLHNRVISASEKIAGHLQIPPGMKVIDIKRLRFVNEVPIQIVTSYLPYDLVPRLAEVDLTNRSLYEFLENECHLFISWGRRFIEAIAANDEEARLLRIEPGAPLVLLDSISYLGDGTPIEYYHAIHRGDRTRFEIKLFRSRELDQSGKVMSQLETLPQGNAIIREA
jgi:GntR family transcriptional regulator